MDISATNHPDKEWLFQQCIDLENLFRAEGGLHAFKACLDRRGINPPGTRATYGVYRKALTTWFIENKVYKSMPQRDRHRKYEFAQLMSDSELDEAMQLHGTRYDPATDDRDEALDDLVSIYQSLEMAGLLAMSIDSDEEYGESERGESIPEEIREDTHESEEDLSCNGDEEVEEEVLIPTKKKSDFSSRIHSKGVGKTTEAFLKFMESEGGDASKPDNKRLQMLKVSGKCK